MIRKKNIFRKALDNRRLSRNAVFAIGGKAKIIAFALVISGGFYLFFHIAQAGIDYNIVQQAANEQHCYNGFDQVDCDSTTTPSASNQVDTGAAIPTATNGTSSGDCGNGVLDSGEECDWGDWHGHMGLYCNDCKYSKEDPNNPDVCGDGKVTGDEKCDTASGINPCGSGKSCGNCDCSGIDSSHQSVCGDGVLEFGEECEPISNITPYGGDNGCGILGLAVCNKDCKCTQDYSDAYIPATGTGSSGNTSAALGSCDLSGVSNLVSTNGSSGPAPFASSLSMEVSTTDTDCASVACSSPSCDGGTLTAASANGCNFICSYDSAGTYHPTIHVANSKYSADPVIAVVVISSADADCAAKTCKGNSCWDGSNFIPGTKTNGCATVSVSASPSSLTGLPGSSYISWSSNNASRMESECSSGPIPIMRWAEFLSSDDCYDAGTIYSCTKDGYKMDFTASQIGTEICTWYPYNESDGQPGIPSSVVISSGVSADNSVAVGTSNICKADDPGCAKRTCSDVYCFDGCTYHKGEITSCSGRK